MNDRSALAWLRDARQFALDAQEVARGLELAEFDRRPRDRFAMQYCLAVVGEALNAIPKDVQALAPEIPWAQIYSLRNRLIHSFWLIDTSIILDIAQNKIAPLTASIDVLIEELEQ
jgi:uncharacterized protein with HEPN domain